MEDRATEAKVPATIGVMPDIARREGQGSMICTEKEVAKGMPRTRLLWPRAVHL
jgi:hypothetical protein